MADESLRQRLRDVLAAKEREMQDPVYRRKIERIRRRRAARARRWEEAFWEHFEHSTFAVYDNVYKRQFGFVCGCQRGKPRAWPVSFHVIIHVRERTRAARTLARRIHVPPPVWVRFSGDNGLRPPRAVRREKLQAVSRSRALLHQFLTREQRWSLRAHGSFKVVGQNGRLYEVGGIRGVGLIVDGRVRTTYCIHPAQELPNYDVLLAQKFLLETNVAHFLATANATTC